MILEGETVLADDYPVYFGYAYLCDGVPTCSEVSGTVFDLKRATRSKEVRKCRFLERVRLHRERKEAPP
jgi:hypothetical protein